MEYKKRLVKILMILILLGSSIAMFLLSENYANQRESRIDASRIQREVGYNLNWQNIFINNEIQTSQGDFQPINYYFRWTNTLSDNQKQIIEDNFRYEIDAWKDNNQSLFQDLQYQAYDTNNPTITCSNTKTNLEQLIDNDTINSKYQWYVVFEFNDEGQLSVPKGTKINGWLNEYQSFCENFSNNLGSINGDNDNIVYQDYCQYSGPKNLKIIYAIPKTLPEDSALRWYLNTSRNHYDYMETLIPYTLIIITIVVLIMMFIPVRLLENIQPFESLKKIKIIFLILIYLVTIYFWLWFMMQIIQNTLNGNFAFYLRQRGAYGAAYIFVPMFNILGWIIMFAYIMYFVFYVKYALITGLTTFFKTHSLIYSLYRYCRQMIKNLTKLDLEDQTNMTALKAGAISTIVIEAMLLTIYLMNHSWLRYYWNFATVVISALLPSLIIGALVTVVVKKMLMTVRKDYVVLLEATQKLSQGKFDDKIDSDLGMFDSLKNEFNAINEGFKEAVNKEVSSQKMKTELISNVSHDLKTPLTSIISYIDLLKTPHLDEDQRQEYLDVLERSSLRLKTLIEDLFEVSKVNSGNIQLDLMEIDVVALTKQILFEYKDKYEDNHLIIKESYPSHKIMCLLDSAKTYRILENLFNNIYKYALPFTRVYIDIFEDDKTVTLAFKNISEGEIPANPEELTERFVQGDKSRKTDGSGLGLAIAKSFTEVQNGIFRIEVDGDLFKTYVIFNKQ